MGDVSGVRLTHVPGTLNGHRRWCVKGEHYPAIAPDVNGRVSGVVYRDVPDSAWTRLDQFEGDMYVRQPVRIEIRDRVTLPAETYVVRPAFLACIETIEWDFDDFLRNGKSRFQKYYKGFQSL